MSSRGSDRHRVGLGLNKVAFFGDAATAIPTIAVVNVWRHMGYTALLVFAGLQTIPEYVDEDEFCQDSSGKRMIPSKST